MRKLSKKYQTEKSKLSINLAEARSNLERAIDSYNEKLQELFEEIKGAEADYNQALQECRQFCADRAQEMQDYYDERSDAWQEGDAGESYTQWKDDWEAFDNVDDIDIEQPDSLEYPDELGDQQNMFDDLPDEVG